MYVHCLSVYFHLLPFLVVHLFSSPIFFAHVFLLHLRQVVRGGTLDVNLEVFHPNKSRLEFLEKQSRGNWEGKADAYGDYEVTKQRHYGSKQGDIETLDYTLSHELRSEQMSAAECASELSSAEQANE